jgi:hypothetical protein
MNSLEQQATIVGTLLSTFLKKENIDMNGQSYTGIGMRPDFQYVEIGRHSIKEPFEYAKKCYGTLMKPTSRKLFNKLVKHIITLDVMLYDAITKDIIEALSSNLYWLCMNLSQRGNSNGWSRELFIIDDLNAVIKVFRARKIANDNNESWPEEDLTEEKKRELYGEIDEDEDILEHAPPMCPINLTSETAPWIDLPSAYIVKIV